MTELDGITDSMYMNLSKFQEIAEDREVWCVAVYGSQRARHTLVTKQQRETQIGKLGFFCVFFFFSNIELVMKVTGIGEKGKIINGILSVLNLKWL